MLQNDIPCGMPQGVIHRFEIIQINLDQRKAFIGLRQMIQNPFEGSPIAQTRADMCDYAAKSKLVPAL